MIFLLKFAWRDARASRGRLALTALAVVAGVAALAATGSLGQNIREAINGQARALLGADMVVESRSAPDARTEAYLAGLGGERAREIAFASMLAVPDGAGGVAASRLVTVRAAEPAYPFYGDAVSEPAGAKTDLAAGDAVLVEETLLKQFGLQPGDKVRLGQKEFRVAGALQKLPGESAAVALLSPRVLVALSGLDGTGLLGPGSLVRYRTHFKFPEGTDVEALAERERGRMRELRMNEDTVAERRRELGRAMENVEAFLSLTGLVALLLGAIGVASAMHAMVRRKLATVAVLRCLGAGAGLGLGVFMAQGVAVGLAGSAAGALAGAGVQAALGALLQDFLPVEAGEFGVHWAQVARAGVIGVALTTLCTLVPLLAVRRVSPLGVLRAVEPEAGRRDPWRWAAGAALAALVLALTVWLAGGWRNGLGFAGGLAAAGLALAVSARLVMLAAKRAGTLDAVRALPFAVRQGLASLHRPGNRTARLVVALGLGAFLLLTLAFSRSALLGQIRFAGSEGRPNLLFFDVQDDQVDGLKSTLASAGAPVVAEAPIVTMRLAKMKGRAVEDWLRDPDSGVPGWTLRREYRSSYRAELADTEKVVAGTWTGAWSAEGAAADEPVPVSVEQGLAEDLQLALGDELEWDVQGVAVRTRVASLREVEWRRMSPNFFVLFPTGVLEGAPKFHVLAAMAEDKDLNARVQRSVASEFGNVSILDLGLVIESLDAVFAKAELAVRFIALFTLATGVVVLAGALAAGREQRVREAVLLRTLGASSRQVRVGLVTELVALGLMAGAAGALLALGGGSAVAVWVFKAPPVLPWAPLVWTVAGVVGLTLITGLLAQRGVARRPPLAVLRTEG
ncbi:MAG: ABC transporter permease [Opitutaceae bacterium]|jgi:putative ABC transport system permease protein|nr:ABC transporter permease [Opitutaceae bacterium]